jgi:hypothetical protein
MNVLDLPPDLEDVPVHAVPIKRPARVGALPSSAVAALPSSAVGETLRESMITAAGASVAAPPNGPSGSVSSSTKSGTNKSSKGAGFARGFLLGGDKGTSSISRKPSDKAPRLPEVQQAMAEATPPMQRLASDTKRWLTPELLAKIASDPLLSAGMSNPRFMAAFAELQGKDPKGAMQRFKVRVEGVPGNRDVLVSSVLRPRLRRMILHSWLFFKRSWASWATT